MAGIADYFNTLDQRLTTALQSPTTQLGVGLLAAGGYQPGNVGVGQRLAQAFGTMQQMQAQQQQLAQQAQLRKIQEAELGVRQQALDVERQKALNADQPKASFQFEKALPDGRRVQYTWNPQTKQYDASEPYTPVDLINAQTGQLNATANQANAGIAQQRLQMEQQKAQEEVLKNQRAAAEAAVKQGTTVNQLDSTYNAADKELAEQSARLRAAAKNPALKNIYGLIGQLPNVPGSAASDLQKDIETIISSAGLTGLVELEKQGIKLTPVSNTDLETAQKKMINLSKGQSPERAAQAMLDYADKLDAARADLRGNYASNRSLYPAAAQPQAAQAPQPGAIMDGYRFKGGNPADPNSWEKQ